MSRDDILAKPAVDGHGGRGLVDDAAFAAAVGALRDLDPAVVDRLLAAVGTPSRRVRPPGFAGLAAIVVGQQVSTASAAAINARLSAAIVPLDPASLLAATAETLQACGLSAAKIRTLRAAAEAIEAGRLPIAALFDMSAEAAHRALVAIPGIGPWTANIFLLFCLGHADAWPAGDLALQEAARLLLALDGRPTTGALEALGERWRPYRGVMATLLWAYYRTRKGRSGVDIVREPPVGLDPGTGPDRQTGPDPQPGSA